MSQGMAGFAGDHELDFAPGTVRGVRCWKLSGDGRLTGAQGHEWQPGENKARCNTYPGLAGHEPPVDIMPPDLERFGPHAGSVDPSLLPRCGCGFWAYWEPKYAPMFTGEPSVTGIIDGYGKTVLGEHGFRSARARLVAVALNFDVSQLLRGRDGLDVGRARLRTLDGVRVWEQMTGRSGPPRRLSESDLDEIRARYETLVADAYPEARVFTSPQIMMKICPPSAGYVPQPAEPATPAACETCGRAGGAPTFPCFECPDAKFEAAPDMSVMFTRAIAHGMISADAAGKAMDAMTAAGHYASSAMSRYMTEQLARNFAVPPAAFGGPPPAPLNAGAGFWSWYRDNITGTRRDRPYKWGGIIRPGGS